MANPGIGGTEFQLLSIALALADHEEFEIEIICSSEIPQNIPNKIKVTKLNDINKFKTGTILISPVSTISKIRRDYLLDCKIILSSHHPHDKSIKKIRKVLPIKLIRVVGAYSFLAESRKIPISYIPNLFLSKACLNKKDTNKCSLTIGNISSHHPSKGTHHVIGMFALLCKQFKGLSLELIGSSALYLSHTDLHERKIGSIFVTPRKDRISALIEDLQSKYGDCEIKEFGLQTYNLPRIVSDWNLAIINPLGIGESDPASIKDCFALNVPVFSTGDFGTWDYQRYFPETTAATPLKLIKKIDSYLNDASLQLEIQKRIIKITKELTERNNVILETWREAIHAVNRNDTSAENYSTLFMPSLISNRMARRIAIRKFLYLFPGYGQIENFIRDRYWSYRLANA